MKKVLVFLIIVLPLFTANIAYSSYGSCSEYGFFAYPDGFGYCKCMSGYVWGTDFLGNKQCVSGTSKCREQYGVMSTYDSLTDKCKCSYGYLFGEDSIGRTQCISESQYCSNLLGSNSSYSSSHDRCECRYGYELSSKTYGGGYECQSCSSKNGIYSKYNSLTQQCECLDGYTLSNGKCVEKQNNVYFLLKELDTSKDKAIIVSGYDSKYYLIEYGIGCISIENYVEKLIVVNLGTDYDVNMWDKVVLPEHNQVCNIIDVDTVDENFSLFEAEEQNSSGLIEWINNSNSKVLDTISYQNNISNSSNNNYIENQRKLIKTISQQLSNRLKGKILLQVEDNGEGWYLNPTNNKRYFLGRPADAFSIMRELGLGISEKDYNFFNGYAPSNLSGRILLRVEASGEAYYVNPVDLKMHFLGRPNDAFELMRKLGLGITNSDIYKININ